MERKITIEEKTIYREDYQIRMLRANDLEGVLKVRGRGANECSCYDYDVSGKMSMKAMFERSKISAKDIKMFLEDLKIVLKEVETFLLNIHCILLKPEYIFYEEERYFFCYYPPARQDLWEEFHGLTEYFIKQADYQDEECARMVFLLHKRTMDENYSLAKLAAECCMQELRDEKEGEEAEGWMRAEEDLEDYVDPEDDYWIMEQGSGASVVRESGGFWTPVKRLLNRRKKSKWGEWDGLYIEEEEL